MAKVSPYFNLTCSSTTAWKGYVNYTLTDDSKNNRTKVNAELWAYKDDGYSSGGNNPLFVPTITIDGVTYGGDDDDRYVTEYSTHVKHLVVSNIYVYHNSTGEKTLTISGKVVKQKDSTDYQTNLDGKNISGSKTITLTDYITGYTLTYNANGGSGAPSSVSNVTSTTISSTVPTRSGYKFLGWSKSSSATSASYVAGNSISLSANTTLYAVWAKIYTVTYNANGGSGTTISQTTTANSSITLCSNSFTAPTSKIWTLTLDGNGGNDGSPTFQGNYFHKWRAGSTTGTVYSEGDSYTPSGDTTMYAWWGTKYIWGTTTRNPDYSEGYTVTLDSNGGTCDIDFLTSEIITTYDFSGWGNLATNPTSTFKIDTIYTQTSDYTAYAIWSPTITNGRITLPTPTRNGYEFLGWSTNEFDTNGITGEYTPTSDLTLYAIWKPMGLVYIYDGIEFNPYQVLIYDSSGWNQYIPYIYTESGWEIYSG